MTDNSNWSLRFNRSLREAGWSETGLSRRDDDRLTVLTLIVCAAVLVLLGLACVF